MIGQFQVRKLPYGRLAIVHMSKCQMVSFLSRNNKQSHIVNILLASFAWSVRQVMDPRVFSFLVLMTCALRAWAIKGSKKIRP